MPAEENATGPLSFTLTVSGLTLKALSTRTMPASAN